ncbi:MAG: DNA cytosine methyltransferase, partial [Bacteroidota bacterium]
MDTTEELRIISICSGSLGIERGIERTGTKLRVVAYQEREAFVCYNICRQMEASLVDKAPVWTDVKTFNARPFRNRIHGIVGGYPCQGESSAGQRLLEKDPRFLWPAIRRQIRECNPLFCFFENVGSHLSGTFKYVLSDLRNMGYAVEAGVFTAAEVGAPHKRQRVFILAWSNTNEFRQSLANAGGQPWDVPKESWWRNPVAAPRSSKAM